MKNLALGFLVLAALASSGCGTSGDSTVNKKIASDYQTFYDSGPSDKDTASSAIDRAIAADPENGYSYYLKASLVAATDAGAALELIEKGNNSPQSIIYVSAPPPEDTMQSLARIRQLGFTVERSEKLGQQLPDYALALRKMGERVAKSEPIASLAVLNGSGVIRTSYKAEIAFWQEAKDEERAKALQEEADAFSAWYEQMSKGLAEQMKDLVREAGKEAGMTEDEIALYGAGKDVGDTGKMAKANRAKEAMYKEEIETLRRFLSEMPSMGGEAGE